MKKIPKKFKSNGLLNHYVTEFDDCGDTMWYTNSGALVRNDGFTNALASTYYTCH